MRRPILELFISYTSFVIIIAKKEIWGCLFIKKYIKTPFYENFFPFDGVPIIYFLILPDLNAFKTQRSATPTSPKTANQIEAKPKADKTRIANLTPKAK